MLIANCLFAALTVAAGGNSAPALPLGLNVTQIENLCRDILLENLPPQFESKENWGHQAKVPGLKIRTKGILVSLEKSSHSVNHGLWKHYVITPIDPKTRLKLRFSKLEMAENQTLLVQLAVSMPLVMRADFQQWASGLKMLAITLEADSTMTAKLDVSVRFETLANGFLPAVMIEPKVGAAELKIEDFKLRKFGDLHQKLVGEFSSEGRDVAEKMLQKQQAKLAGKANKAVLKKYPDGKITLSASQLLK